MLYEMSHGTVINGRVDGRGGLVKVCLNFQGGGMKLTNFFFTLFYLRYLLEKI